MKKIFLGLFLTVGVSGFALAGSVENANNPSSSNLCKSENSIGSEDVEESLRRNCATQYFVRSYNCDDSYDVIASGYYTHECGSNQPEGELTIEIVRTTGCPGGGPL